MRILKLKFNSSNSFVLFLFTNLFFFIVPSLNYSQELTPEQIFEKVNPSVVVVMSYDSRGNLISQGSGVVFDSRGYVVTNYHVMAEGINIEIENKGRTIEDIAIIGIDIQKDILILKIPENIFPALRIADASNLKPGQRIYAIGSPYGLENTITEGIISGLRLLDKFGREFIQISASISSGSSGGAVVNTYGELIGISTMTIEGGQNLNFAIKVNEFQEISLKHFTENDIQNYNLFYKGFKAIENGDYQSAVKYFTDYIRENKENANAYYNRGYVYDELGEYSKAISDLTKAVEINPIFAEAYCTRGVVFYKLNEYSKAILDYTKAMSINPNFEFA